MSVETETQNETDQFTEKLFGVLLILVISGLLVTLFYPASRPDFASFTAAVGLLFAVAGASMLGGGFVGFLFGVPLRLQQNATLTPRDAGDSSDAPIYGGNTNLEQISDWLTKILVGVTLTQIDKIAGYVNGYAANVAAVLNDGGGSSLKALPIAIMAYFFVCGFLAGYLWARLYLVGAFSAAERRTLKTKLELAQKDAAALGLVNSQLGAKNVVVEQVKLNSVIADASPEMLAYIFYKAAEVRDRTYKAQKELMERTISIFRALTERGGLKFHRNWGQLGYALKDKREPSWKEARDALSTAIQIRGAASSAGWHSYEANRVICHINLDEDFRARQPTAATRKAEIMADLKVALEDPWVRSWLPANDDVTKWLNYNPDSDRDLQAFIGTLAASIN